MKWEEFIKNRIYHQVENFMPTNIECPDCGSYIVRRDDIILTSYPPKSQYHCLKCGWHGSA